MHTFNVLSVPLYGRAEFYQRFVDELLVHSRTPVIVCDPGGAVAVPQVEKWEGYCYDGCMYNASKDMPCYPSCNVEGDNTRLVTRQTYSCTKHSLNVTLAAMICMRNGGLQAEVFHS